MSITGAQGADYTAPPFSLYTEGPACRSEIQSLSPYLERPARRSVSQTPLYPAQLSTYAGSQSYMQQAIDFVSSIAHSVAEKVMEFIGPLFGFQAKGAGTPLSSISTNALSTDPFGGAFVMQAAKKTAAPPTAYDNIMNWFGKAGSFGKDLYNVMKDGRDFFQPIMKGIGWLWDNVSNWFSDDTVSKVSTSAALIDSTVDGVTSLV